MDRSDVLRLLLDRRGVLLGYIATILPDRAAGEDIFQETLIRACDQAESLDHPGHALAWARGTARNLALNEARTAFRRHVPLDGAVLDALDADWARDESGDDLDRLEGCLQKLAPQARTLVRLRFAETLDTPAIAARVGKTTDAVHQAFSRIFRTLEACLKGGAPA
jgi:RNA polymerase sigma-70 factor (ECF subfamily)